MPRRTVALGALSAAALAGGSAWVWLRSERTLGWTLLGLIALAAGVCALLWQRAESLRRAAERERARLARDLQEDIGARLLNHIVSAPNAEQADAARATLGEVRALIEMLDGRAFTLAECLAAWRARFVEQCAAAGIVADVHLPERAPALVLPPALRGNPPRIVAEFVDNAARHARPTRAALEIELVSGELRLRLRHDGHRAARGTWRPARGLRNLALRAQDLDAQLEWREHEQILELELRCPLPADGL